MTKNKTQSQCKDDFLAVCSQFLEGIIKIDKDTPYTIQEPSWWIDMMEAQKYVREVAAKYQDK